MAQDSYLIRADEASLTRWKRAAKDQGRTFAAFVRDSLDIAADGTPEVLVPPAQASSGRRAPVKSTPSVVAQAAGGRERTSICEHRRPVGQFCRYCDGGESA